MPEARTGHCTIDLRVDAHVHVYPFMSVAATLDAAAHNLFEEHAGGPRHGVLLVADPEGVDGWERLARSARAGRWQRVGIDGDAVTFRRDDDVELAAVKGQQLVSREGLEVLGTGCRARVPSGLPVADIVERIRAAGGLAILAWGAGKWLGDRGRVVDDVIARESGQTDVMLADNGGRPRLWPRVPQFETAAEHGLRVLAGTDPLPLRGEERRIGSYGVRVRVRVPGGPAALQDALRRPEVPVEIVGRRVTTPRFAAGQLRLRLARAATGKGAP